MCDMAPPLSVTTMSAAAMQGWCLVATMRVLLASNGPCSVCNSSAAVCTSTAANMSSHSQIDLSAPCKMDSREVSHLLLRFIGRVSMCAPVTEACLKLVLNSTTISQ